jgi:peptidoglycan hydrolase CwlO-like protein
MAIQMRALSEELMKAQMSMESTDKLSNRKEEEMNRMNAEIERLKQQITQKDEDLRSAMSSVRDMQKQAQEEKSNFWAEFR